MFEIQSAEGSLGAVANDEPWCVDSLRRCRPKNGGSGQFVVDLKTKQTRSKLSKHIESHLKVQRVKMVASRWSNVSGWRVWPATSPEKPKVLVSNDLVMDLNNQR